MGQIHHLSERQNHRCCYCGHRMIDIEKHHYPHVPRNAGTREHAEPKSYDGPTTIDNLVAACKQCNELRGNMDYVAFSNLIQKWFKRDPTLQARWHYITVEELRRFKFMCLQTHERQLRGLSKTSEVYASRHERLLLYHGDQLLRA